MEGFRMVIPADLVHLFRMRGRAVSNPRRELKFVHYENNIYQFPGICICPYD